MSMRASTTLSLTALFLIANSCSPRAFDAATEEAKLLRRDSEWSEAASSGKDIEKILSYWSDDALLIFPGQPVLEGKAAIRPYVASSLSTPGFKIRWVSSKAVFSADRKMAYMPATEELTAPGPDGRLITKQLRGIAIWRLEPDGQWRCVVDIANEQPTAAAPSNPR
jgi:ketosteroid isomerase-like protein